MPDYTFDATISRPVLENYLKRACSAAWLMRSTTLKDDLRVIARLGLKFIGRAAAIWTPDPDDEEHFAAARLLAQRVHAQDSEIILQACVFEIVYRMVDSFPVPAYVLEDFGQPVEQRCFRYDDMIFPERPRAYCGDHFPLDQPWLECSIPDLSRIEAQMWFYYRATRYIDAGYEALHMGQIHLYTANDCGMKQMDALLQKIRAYAGKHARRHLVLMDAHSHGVSINGRLLLDYNAMPYTRAAITDRPGRRLALIREGFSEGGLNPNGWFGDAMPYLMEYDNWGGKCYSEDEGLTEAQLAIKEWWGYDQIGWFANQSEENRRHFLEYTLKWTAVNNPNAYFAIPLRRTLDSAAVRMQRGDDGREDVNDYFQLNNRSAACPMGFGGEDTISALWTSGEFERLRALAANPENLVDYGARDLYDPETRMKLPEIVTVYGDFQHLVGAVDGDSSNERTRMYYIGDNTYTLSVVIPFAGTYRYAVSNYGTLSATYCWDRFPRSGYANLAQFTTDKDNQVVRFRYRFIDNCVSAEVF